MLDMPPDSCIDKPGSPPDAMMCAADVARGVIRMLLRHDLPAMTEVPLDGGRRADLMAVDARGQIVIVEIKVSRADLLGDDTGPEKYARSGLAKSLHHRTVIKFANDARM